MFGSRIAALLPKWYPADPVLNKGTQWLFDMVNPVSNPNADGGIAANATFINLVSGAPNATNIYSSNTNIAGKKGVQTPGTGATAGINLGDNQFKFPITNSYLVIIWLKFDTSGYQTSDLALFQARNVNRGQWMLQAGAGGNSPYFMNRDDASGSAVNSQLPAFWTGGTGFGAVHQLAMSFEPLVTRGFMDGVQVSSVAAPVTAPDIQTTWSPALFRYFKGVFYRTLGENLTLSGKTALRQVQRDYSANVARFV